MSNHKTHQVSSPPIPLFDTLICLPKQAIPDTLSFLQEDFDVLRTFLLQYVGSETTYITYRRECERLIQWSWLIKKKSLLRLKRPDIEDYIHFCQKPPLDWIGTKKVARFINKDGIRLPNPEWKLFVVGTKKSAFKEGHQPDIRLYCFSQKALQSLFIVISSLYNHCIRENLTEINPIIQIRQKSQFLRKRQGKRQIRRLTSLQWETVIETAEKMACEDPKQHERTLFIVSSLYLLYLRISELAASSRWEPQMGHFYRDSQGNWWFKTVGKGNKERDVSVSQSMLVTLRRYRRARNLFPDLPMVGETTPLIHKITGTGGLESTRQIRSLVQVCFDRAVQHLLNQGFLEEGKSLAESTVHWLRHTGISDDLNKNGRPLAHVRDDAGHSSTATTDLYNDAELQERHASAANKPLKAPL